MKVFSLLIFLQVGESTDVVMIIADDLRPELSGGVYGCNHVHTPNLAKLSEESVTFTSAYAQIALCAPSRNSFLSGRAPDATLSYQFIDHFREVGADWTSLPGLFKRYNYTVVGAGKIFHPSLPPYWDMPMSWDDRMNNSLWEPWLYPSEARCPFDTTWCAIKDGKTSSFEDTQTTEQIYRLVQNITSPFFLAAGFRKPHLQWRYPAELEHKGPVPLPKHTLFPVDAPSLAFHMPYNELLDNTDVQACGGAGSMAPDFAYPLLCQHTWRKAYYSATTFLDREVGKILKVTNEKTLTVFFSDHGWHLGDAAEWEKFTNFENALRVPLMIKHKSLAPQIRQDPVELLDLYPTLAALLHLDTTFIQNESHRLDGRNLFPNSLQRIDSFSSAARSQFPRCVGGYEYNNGTINTSYPLWYLNDCNDVPRANFSHMGYSLRTFHWRFTAWFTWDGQTSLPLHGFSSPPAALELYPHLDDNGTCPSSSFDFEHRNLAPLPQYQPLLDRFLTALPFLFGPHALPRGTDWNHAPFRDIPGKPPPAFIFEPVAFSPHSAK